MKSTLAATLVLLSLSAAQASECPLEGAVFESAANGWQLRFSPVPREAGANQLAAFELVTPGIDGKLAGGILVPNGFGQPMADIGLDCPAVTDEDAEPVIDPDTGEAASCGFWNGSVYVLVDAGLEALTYDVESFKVTRAPAQILLPDFAAAVWYSRFREDAFTDDMSVSDVYTLEDC